MGDDVRFANGMGDDVRFANGMGWGDNNDERKKIKDERRKTLRVLIIDEDG